jgi:IclR family mhp operon transcriptional activator
MRSLERALDVLEVLHDARAMELKDLHRVTGLPKPTLLRVLGTLQSRGLVWRRVADRAFLPSAVWGRRAAPFDEEARLVEVASPLLVALGQKVRWPSVLAVPRLDFMELIENTSAATHLTHIAIREVGYRINMLRSATGSAYLAFCGEGEREAILTRLRASARAGDALASDAKWVARRLGQVRERGYGFRDPGFGGHYDQPRRDWDDARESLAVPIASSDRLLGCINITWPARADALAAVAQRHLEDLRQASRAIAAAMAEAKQASSMA